MESKNLTRTITWKRPDSSSGGRAEVCGLDYLKALKNGTTDPPPAAMLVGYRVVDVEKGHAVFELQPEEYHYNPFSTVHGGIISTLLDSAMIASVLSTLEKGVSCSTVEIKVNFIRPVSSRTGTLRCEARPVHIGKRLATVEGRVTDTRGKLVSHGVSTCSIFKL